MNVAKRFSWQIGAGILLVLAALGGSLRGAPEPVDPIVGDWVWRGRESVVFRPDGTLHHSHGAEGTWQYLHNPEVQRHYRIVWNRGTDIDELVCSEDGQRAHIRTQFGPHAGLQGDASRKTIASPTPAPGKPALASATPARSTMPPAGPTTEPADPIVGNWFWYKNLPTTFKADGTMSRKDGLQGKWEFLHNPEAQRHYRTVWDNGKFIDDVVFKEDGQSAHVSSNKGPKYDVRRVLGDPPADSGNAPNYFGSRKP